MPQLFRSFLGSKKEKAETKMRTKIKTEAGIKMGFGSRHNNITYINETSKTKTPKTETPRTWTDTGLSAAKYGAALATGAILFAKLSSVREAVNADDDK